jgi:hypothetical protein
MLRVSPQTQPAGAAHPWQEGRGRAADLEFSRKRIARDVRKCLESAIANAENNHDLDVDDLVVVQAHVGKALVLKRHMPRRAAAPARFSSRSRTSPSWCVRSRRRPRAGREYGSEVNPIRASGWASTAPGIRAGCRQDQLWVAAARGYEDPPA